MSLFSFTQLRENPTSELLELIRDVRSYWHLVEMGMISNPGHKMSQAEGARRRQDISLRRKAMDLTNRELTALVNLHTMNSEPGRNNNAYSI